MSQDNDDTSSPGSRPASAPKRDVLRKLVAGGAGATRSLTESEKRAVEKRAAKKERKSVAKKSAEAVLKATKSLERLARDADIDRMTKLTDTIALRGLELAAGLFEDPTSPTYNPDAIVPMPDASTRTHFGMTVYKQMMAKQRENMATARALGVVVLQGRKSEEDWNAEARRVDEEQRHAHALEVATEIIKENGG
jgi:hypothetical protein